VDRPGAERRAAEAAIGAELASWGKVIVLETSGRVTGRPARAAIGFVDDPDGSLYVAAGDPDADWAANLDADPACRVSIGDVTWDAFAAPIEGPERGRAIRGLILKYGTSAERLGNGPVYRLRRLPPGAR
jgi:deazaflavin-dependent oxidoreductase (nitroreductase family)